VAGNAVVPSPRDLRYTCELEHLPPQLADRFVPLDCDPATLAFVREAPDRRHGWWLTHAQSLLSGLLGDFNANGLLETYPMHLLSTEQWSQLLGHRPGGRLLDVGAGSGDVTASLAPLFDEVVTTESSWAMARRLRRRGLRCVRTDLRDDRVPDAPYGTIACLNVLDRCDRPLDLVSKLAAAVKPEGRLLLSLPLPYSPCVYDGSNVRSPNGALPLSDTLSWEHSLATLVREVLEPLKLSVDSWSRAPYLSGGDCSHAYYSLDAAVLVTRAPT
jgi:SAM-dependent methyltransferase